MATWPARVMPVSLPSSLMKSLLLALTTRVLLPALRQAFVKRLCLMGQSFLSRIRMSSKLRLMKVPLLTLSSITVLVLGLLWTSLGWVPTLSEEVWELVLLSVSILVGVPLGKLLNGSPSSSIVVVNARHGKEVSKMAYRRRYSGRRSRVRRGRRSRGVNRIGFRM